MCGVTHDGSCSFSVIFSAKIIMTGQLCNSSLVSHFNRDFPHVELFQIWAAFEAKFNVAFLVENDVPVEGQIRKLVAIFQTRYVFEVGDLVVGKERALQFEAVVQPRDIVNYVPAQV